VARPQTPQGELTAHTDPLARFKGPTSKGRGGEGALDLSASSF